MFTLMPHEHNVKDTVSDAFIPLIWVDLSHRSTVHKGSHATLRPFQIYVTLSA